MTEKQKDVYRLVFLMIADTQDFKAKFSDLIDEEKANKIAYKILERLVGKRRL